MVKITVLGSYNQDITMITPKIPRPKETITGATLYLNPGGKGNNQANAAHKLGAEVFLIAKVGKDVFGTAALEYLKSEGMSIKGIIQDDSGHTGTAVILVDEKTRQNQITVAPGMNHRILPKEIDVLKSEIESSEVCIFQLENNLDAILHTIKINKEVGNLIILNPAPMRDEIPLSIFNHVDILIMNEIEASIIAKIEVTSRSSALLAAKKVTKTHRCISIITLGEHGVIAWDGKQEYFHPSFKVSVKDTTGAGDAFIGAFSVKYGETKDLFQSLQFASAAAAINITRIGASPANPLLNEVVLFLNENNC